jgi:hypothetical protein
MKIQEPPKAPIRPQVRTEESMKKYQDESMALIEYFRTLPDELNKVVVKNKELEL